jgi:protein-S-isoprenylcysteine O-methyltransferase
MFSALVIACSGEALRIIAFFTCKSNFTHLVSYRKSKSHELVTEGVYSVFRHPAYTGYFYFSVFGQIFLGNILSSILFAITLNKFFTDRIHD